MPDIAHHSALGSSLALVLWGTDASGADEVVVYPGILLMREGVYYLSRKDGTEVSLEDEWLPLIQTVPEDLREVLRQCDFQLKLTVGDVEEEDASTWKKTGLMWPPTPPKA